MFGREKPKSQSLLMFDTEKEQFRHQTNTQHQGDEFYLAKTLQEEETQTSSYDALGAKLAYSKYLAVRNVLLFVNLTGMVIGCTTCNLSYPLMKHDSPANYGLMITATFLKIALVILYVFSLKKWSVYLRCIGKLEENEGFIEKRGTVWTVLLCIVFFIHPIHWLHGVKWDLLVESYFLAEGKYDFFVRDINEHLYIIQFGVLFWQAYLIFLENSYYAATRSQRVCRMFGFENDILFVIKSTLAQNGMVFVFLSLIFIMYYFATLFNMAEMGYVLNLKRENYPSEEDFMAAMSEHALLTRYYNTYWNVIITITTIGYGDMYVRSTLARCFVFLVAIMGAIIIPVLIVTVSNLFELMRSEANAMDLYHKVKAKERVQQKAGRLIGTIARLRMAQRRKNAKDIERFENKVVVLRKEFSQVYADYRNQFFITEVSDLFTRIEKTEKKYNILRTHFLPYILREKEEQSNKSD